MLSKVWTFLNSTLGIWFLSTCIVGVISWVYNERQHEMDAAAKNASLVTTLLPHLTSPDAKQSRMAIAITGYLKEKGKLPGELESALVAIVTAPNSPTTSSADIAKREAAAAVIDLPKQPTKLSDRVEVAGLPPRIYIQIPTEGQRQLAQDIQTKLREKQFIAPGIENIEKKARAPSQTEVRYYQESERSEALEILQVLKDAKLTVKSEPQLIPGQKNVRPRHYEIWFSP
jgi:hypothetical protein